MIFTFYSFKGGVGRSMAVANVGEELYRRGLKVLLVDFDLEAPGLERFFDAPADILAQRGVIDMVLSYKALRAMPGMDSAAVEKLTHSRFRFPVEPLASFIKPIYEENEKGGALYLIPAGRAQ